jgi:hypothetical protein
MKELLIYPSILLTIIIHPFSAPSATPLSDPPSPQRQRLQLHRRRFNETPECDHPYYDTYNIHDIISIPLDIAYASSLYTSVLFLGQRAGECLGYYGAAEFGVELVSRRRGDAGGDCEGVDEF